jgi:hypothetical protein
MCLPSGNQIRVYVTGMASTAKCLYWISHKPSNLFDWMRYTLTRARTACWSGLLTLTNKNTLKHVLHKLVYWLWLDISTTVVIKACLCNKTVVGNFNLFSTNFRHCIEWSHGLFRPNCKTSIKLKFGSIILSQAMQGRAPTQCKETHSMCMWPTAGVHAEILDRPFTCWLVSKPMR